MNFLTSLPQKASAKRYIVNLRWTVLDLLNVHWTAFKKTPDQIWKYGFVQRGVGLKIHVSQIQSTLYNSNPVDTLQYALQRSKGGNLR